jgi:hypothetical protein
MIKLARHLSKKPGAVQQQQVTARPGGSHLVLSSAPTALEEQSQAGDRQERL